MSARHKKGDDMEISNGLGHHRARRSSVVGYPVGVILGCFVFSCDVLASVAVPDRMAQEMTQLFGDRQRSSAPGTIDLDMPAVAENGRTVPIVVDATRAGKVKTIYLFAENNPYPLVAIFNIGPEGVAYVSTNIRLKISSYVVVVVELTDGRLVQARKMVKVTIGGCGGGHWATASAWTAPQPAHYSERYSTIVSNPVNLTANAPVSTFSVDVDTGSYSNIRRFLLHGQLPPADAVRIEEMVNYFSYDTPAPMNSGAPFSLATELVPTPWNRHTVLMRIGLRAIDRRLEDLPPVNLVFLVDVSGSMAAANKLPLLKSSLRLLVRRLRLQDSVALVVYAGAAGVVLPPTAGNKKAQIVAALDRLEAGGSTNGGAGISLAYSLAKQAFVKGGINRVMLATDGDFNVGTVSNSVLLDLVKRQRQAGISLTTLGFGVGNYNEALTEQLANVGNGNYAYIDSLKEAHKVLYQQFSGTMSTVAEDVKIQVQFNPHNVVEYRLIGYVNRKLERQDFSNDEVDAGEIGVGHQVTALYELVLQGRPSQWIEPTPYETIAPGGRFPNQVAQLRLRYKLPGQRRSTLLTHVVRKSSIHRKAGQASTDLRFASAVAAFGQLLRGGKYSAEFTYADVSALASGALGDGIPNHRHEFLQLVDLAATLSEEGG